MKLTKGKISKLYNKKKQTNKKRKMKKKLSRSNKTFRKKYNLDLSNKTLKKYKKFKGGNEEDESKLEESLITPPSTFSNVSSDAKPISLKEETIEEPSELEPSKKTTTEEQTIENLELETPSIQEDISIQPMESKEELETSPVELEEVNVESTPNEDLDIKAETSDIAPISTEEDIKSVEPVKDDTTIMSEKDVIPETIIDEPIPSEEIEEEVFIPSELEKDEDLPESDIVLSEPQEESIKEAIKEKEEEIKEDEKNIVEKSTTPSLEESLDVVVDYISDKIASKVSQTMSGKEQPQNGFEAVQKATETIATSTGGKKKRTSKFRLKNKNKTRRI